MTKDSIIQSNCRHISLHCTTHVSFLLNIKYPISYHIVRKYVTDLCFNLKQEHKVITFQLTVSQIHDSQKCYVLITSCVIIDELEKTQTSRISSTRHSTSLSLVEVRRNCDNSLVYWLFCNANTESTANHLYSNTHTEGYLKYSNV